jgi:outer membrane receptor protein involved in Fe transport
MGDLRNFRLVLIALLAVGLSGPGLAQDAGEGRITGTVTDPTGAVIPDVTVTATHQDTGVPRQAVSTGTGVYNFTRLQIGEYTVSVSATGFKTFQRIGIGVFSGITVPLDIQLEVGDITETVTVEAATPTLDTTTETVGTTRGSEEIGRLPLPLVGNSSRAAISLYRTLPGVNFEPLESGGQDFMVFSRSTVNGSLAGQSGYKIDGVEAGSGDPENAADFISPNPETVEEIRIVANADAASGFNGGVAVEMTMKSGTNDFHGALYHYMRNGATSARDFFDTSGESAPDIQNNGGVVVGGPIIKNKTFFFASIDIYRFRQPVFGSSGTAIATVTLPTQLMRGGDFSELIPSQNRPIYDPLTSRSDGMGGFTRDQFPNNTIPSARLSGISQRMQEKMDLPNRAGTVNNWQGLPEKTLIDIDKPTFKVDHHINDNHRFSFSYEASVPWFLPEVSGKSGHSFIAGGASYLDEELDTGFIDDRDMYRYRFNYLWTASPSTLVTFRAGITRSPDRFIDAWPNVGPRLDFGCQIGLPSPNTLGSNRCTTPTASIEGFANMGTNRGRTNTKNTKVPTGIGVNWYKGSHNLKIGVDAWFIPQGLITGGGGGTYSFTQRITGLPGDPTTGAGYASFLLGEVDTASVTSDIDTSEYSAAWAFYVQDQWRLNNKWTLTAGLRWNIFQPLRGKQGKMGFFNPTIPNPRADGFLGAIEFYGLEKDGPGLNGIRTINDTYYKAFSPHFGLAYRLNPKTVIRASYSLSTLPFWTKPTFQIPSPGWNTTLNPQTLDSGITPAFNWEGEFPQQFPAAFPILDPGIINGSSVRVVDRSENIPAYSQNISFEVGRELPRGTSFRVAYVGNLSRRMVTRNGVGINGMPLQFLSMGDLLNADIDSQAAIDAGIPKPYPSYTGSVAQALRPFPQYQNIFVFGAQFGSSTYHAMQMNLQKRTGDLSFLVSYTVSKQLSNTDYPGWSGQGSVTRQHPNVLHLSRALLGKDRPQILGISWAYDLPFGSGKKFMSGASRGLDYVVGGWRLSAIQNYMAGNPIRINSSQSIPGGFGRIWPVRVPGVPVQSGNCGDYNPGRGDRYLNPDAFTSAAPFTLGDTSMLPNVRSCAVIQENIQLQKVLQITERWGVSFGTIWQNALNHHFYTWRRIQRRIENPAFGQWTAGSPPRNIMFFLRVEF